MGAVATGTISEQHRPASRDYHLAWWSLLLFVISLAAAVIVSEIIANAYGYSGIEDDRAPEWLVWAAGYPALLIFIIPAFVTTHYARRAMRDGRREALVPLVVAWGLCAVFALQNVLAYLVEA